MPDPRGLIVIHDRRGRRARFDTQEVKGRGLNRWQGWLCSVGRETLYVDHDGAVFRGTCRVGGPIGHVARGFETEDDWIACTRPACTCGTEIKIAKARDHESLRLLGRPADGAADPDLDLGATAAVECAWPNDLHVHWDLGRRCNHDCSYCTANLHNNHEAHKDYEVLVAFLDDVLDHAEARGKTARFCFAGGEPTLHPRFLDFCRLIRERGHRTLVTTNGTRGPHYWRELIRLADAHISYHFEFARFEKLRRNVEAVIEARRAARAAGGEAGYLRIKVLPQPHDFAALDEVIGRFRALPGFDREVSLEIAPLRRLKPRTELMDYTPEQVARFGRVT